MVKVTAMSPRTPAPVLARARPTPPLMALVTLLTLLALVASGLLVAAPVAEAARYTPDPGVTFNNPLGTKPAQHRILDHVLKSVDSAPRGSAIRFASWNIRGGAVVDALVRAHRRGVGVRVVMDKKNAYALNPNREVNRLQQELKRAGNRKRPGFLRSGLRKCKASCRGNNGFGHSKFFLFSQSGKAQRVVVNTSANATDLSATAQWNDAYTLVGDQVVYDAFVSVFDQMYADQPVDQPYLQVRSGATVAEFYPFRGAGTEQDPILRELEQVRCRGAQNTPGGRTTMRIAMTSWHGGRGIAIGKRIRELSRQGCDIRVVYAVMGNQILRDLRRGGRGRVALRHIVQDFDRDGVYDRYLHTKVLTIQGRYGDERSATVTINGSANWTPLSLISDEAVLRIDDRGTLRRYRRWIERLFAHPPKNPPGSRSQILDRRAVGAPADNGSADPYARIQVD
ncbi:MAG: phospholipase D-like domain-containing protein [Nocardioides sp.]|nr:phospholipase D-like domain-containing protein [Nocardioides sp.]